ncbi:snaclec A9-like [Rhineura floridana]|uniref:snaclec A9-like n=1 Tax=Rhineura floridana TaxID=261503 RepID=UPI002AC87D6D|nr:snaclec A9-like [Rhineura floridana]
MAQVICLGLCLLGCLVLNPLVEGANNATAASRSVCSSGILYYKRYCYQLVNSYLSWESAEIKCQELNPDAQLASILSANEGNIIYNYLKRFNIDSVWIGLQATPINGYMIWQWSDGSSCTSPLWDGRSPSLSISSNKCISLYNVQYSSEVLDLWKMPSVQDLKGSYPSNDQRGSSYFGQHIRFFGPAVSRD